MPPPGAEGTHVDAAAPTAPPAAAGELEPFAGYPRDGGFAANLDWHRRVAANEIRTSWFLHGDPKIAMVCLADPRPQQGRDLVRGPFPNLLSIFLSSIFLSINEPTPQFQNAQGDLP